MTCGDHFTTVSGTNFEADLAAANSTLIFLYDEKDNNMNTVPASAETTKEYFGHYFHSGYFTNSGGGLIKNNLPQDAQYYTPFFTVVNLVTAEVAFVSDIKAYDKAYTEALNVVKQINTDY